MALLSHKYSFLLARDDRLFLVILAGWGEAAAGISQSRENPKFTAGSPKMPRRSLGRVLKLP